MCVTSVVSSGSSVDRSTCVCPRCDARVGVGRLYLLPERRRPSGAADVGPGDPAGPPPGPGPGLRSHGGRGLGLLLWYDPAGGVSGWRRAPLTPPASWFAGAAETFRGIGMASLVILLIFSFIQCLSREMEGKGGSKHT